MKNQRDKLHQYQKRITAITSRETAIARECLARGDKPKALLALRRKKFQESLLSKTDSHLETLEHLTSNIEFSLVQKDVMFGLQQGTSVLKQIHAEMGGIEHVEKLMGESEDARAYQQDISDMLGGQISNQEEDEVEDELAALEAKVRPVRAAEAPAELEFPLAPGTVPEIKEPEGREPREYEAEPAARGQVNPQQAEPMLA